MKALDYDYSWVPKLHWLEVVDGNAGWIAVLCFKGSKESAWERTLFSEPIMVETRTKPNWLGMTKQTTKRVEDVLELTEKDIIKAFDKLREKYIIREVQKDIEAERHRLRQEVQQKYTGKLGQVEK